MGNGASIKDGYIEVNTDAWLSETTGGAIPELTDLYQEFDWFVHKQTSLWLDTVLMFIIARSGPDWADEEPATLKTPDGGGTVNLSEDMIVHRYFDPVHGPVALVTTDFEHGAGDTTAYDDSGRDSSRWFSYHEVNIFCPHGHGWTYRSGELRDDQGNSRSVKDIFPDGDIVTQDADSDSDTYGDDCIICPTCGEFCDVDLPSN